MDSTYANMLKQYVTQPGSYTGSPGFQFALNTGLDNVARRSAAAGMNGSGNMAGELTKYATGLAGQDYGATLDRLNAFAGREGQQSLGETQAANTLALGHEANANTRAGNDQSFGLGMYRAGNDYNLGNRTADNTAQSNWWNYDLGRRGDATTQARDANNFTLGSGTNAVNWYNAGTQRGNAQSDAWNQDQQNQRAWYSINPKQRMA